MIVLELRSDPDVCSLGQIIVFKNGTTCLKLQFYLQLEDLAKLGPDLYMVALS